MPKHTTKRKAKSKRLAAKPAKPAAKALPIVAPKQAKRTRRTTPKTPKIPNVSEEANATPVIHSAYELVGLQSVKYPDCSYVDYRDRIALMSRTELSDHAAEVDVQLTFDISRMRDRLEKAYLERNPGQRAEAARLDREDRECSVEEQTRRILDPDYRVNDARARRPAREAREQARKQARERAMTLEQQAPSPPIATPPPIIKAGSEEVTPQVFSAYALAGIVDVYYPDKTFDDYRERIALMTSMELERHLEEVKVLSTPNRSAVLDRLERAYVERNPGKRKPADNQPASEERVAQILEPDQRTNWAKRRKQEREQRMQSIEEQAKLFVARALR